VQRLTRLQAKQGDIEGPNANLKDSIHHWAEHGIAGRGVLLDYYSYAQKIGIQYNPYEYHAITYDDLDKCGKDQGIDIRPASEGGHIQIGDMLMIRSGFVAAYHSKTADERTAAALRPHVAGVNDKQRWAGIMQEDKVLDWLHDCYFSTLAGDAPAFEAWPSQEGNYVTFLCALYTII
jgi:hypothetical protein